MTPVVLDCSAVLCWCFADETTAASERLFEAVENHGAVVPPIWHLEVANILLLAERRGRLPPGIARERLDWLAELPIVVDEGGSAWGAIFGFAARERLTTYDAAYLELAVRIRADLASKDRELVVAARRNGLHTIPLVDE